MRLVSTLIARLANAPIEQLSSEIDDSLRRLCEALGFDRASVWEIIRPPSTVARVRLAEESALAGFWEADPETGQVWASMRPGGRHHLATTRTYGYGSA